MDLDFRPDHIVGTLLSIGLVLFFIYRRFRRNFGRQKLRPAALKFRIVLLCIIGGLLLIPTFFSTEKLLVTALGAGIGVALAIWAAKHTRFEKQDGTLYYIPHTYTGMVVSALFLGRILYKIVVLSSSGISVATTDGAFVSPWDFGGLSAITGNPVTRCVFFILVGYYVYYYVYVLQESEHLKPEDWEKPAPPADKPTTGGNV